MKILKFTLPTGRPVSIIADTITHWYSDVFESKIFNTIICLQSGISITVTESCEQVEQTIRKIVDNNT